MKNLYDVYKTEKDFEVDGVWKDFGYARVKIARAGNRNTNYIKTFRDVTKPYKKSNFRDDETDNILAEIFSKSIIKGWEIKDENDNWVSGIHILENGDVIVAPFNSDNVKRCLLDLPDLFNEIRNIADDLRTFQKEKEEEEAKN